MLVDVKRMTSTGGCRRRRRPRRIPIAAGQSWCLAGGLESFILFVGIKIECGVLEVFFCWGVFSSLVFLEVRWQFV